jgi:hypothetical protein
MPLPPPAPKKAASAFYAPASFYGPLQPLPRLPNVRIGSKYFKPPPLAGCFSEEQYGQFAAQHQLDETRLKALDLQSYQSACASFGVSLDPLVTALVKLRASGKQDVEYEEANLARGFVKQNFKFRNNASMNATQVGGGDAPSKTDTSKKNNGVQVFRRDGSPIDTVSLSLRLTAVSNSLKHSTEGTSLRKGGVADSLTYDFRGRPVGDMERVVVLVLAAIADIANQMMYSSIVSADALKPFSEACWPGLQYRATAPADAAEQSGYFSLKNGVLDMMLAVRAWVLKTTKDRLSTAEDNLRQEILSEGITDIKFVEAGKIANATKDLGALNIVPRLKENESETLARLFAHDNVIADLPCVTAPITDDATSRTLNAYVPPEFLTNYHEFLAKGIVARVDFRLQDFTVKSQQLAMQSIVFCGAATSAGAGAAPVLSIMDNPDAFLQQAEKSSGYQLMLQLAGAGADCSQLALGKPTEEEEDAALAAAAAEFEAAAEAKAVCTSVPDTPPRAEPVVPVVPPPTLVVPSVAPPPPATVVHVPVPSHSDDEHDDAEMSDASQAEAPPMSPPPKSPPKSSPKKRHGPHGKSGRPNQVRRRLHSDDDK